MEGLNIDVGHLRHIRWTQDDNPDSAINNKPELTHSGRTAAHNRWIAYNKMRGQYGSAMEHAIPEQFWVDRNKCSYLDDKGQLQNPSLPQCAEAISAVKAIAIAQSEGQKIYTINKDNAATALPKLQLSGTVGQEIRSAIEAGKEVTFHEKAISAHGWSGQGYIIVDPETGAGAYLIEGKGNGGNLEGDFGQRYLAWVSAHMLTGKYVIAAELALIAFMTVPKAWFGFPLALGTPNLYTTVLRAVALSLHFMALSRLAGVIGPYTGYVALLIITGIGFYNLGTLLAGFIYARLDNENGSDSCWRVIVAGHRDTCMA